MIMSLMYLKKELITGKKQYAHPDDYCGGSYRYGNKMIQILRLEYKN